MAPKGQSSYFWVLWASEKGVVTWAQGHQNTIVANKTRGAGGGGRVGPNFWWPLRAQVAENLALFRRWCFATYGGVAVAFHALDADGSGSLSEEEFVSIIECSSFKGDAHAAWKSLNLEASDILSEREMDFLDDMELDMLAAYVSATEAAEEAEAQKYEHIDRSGLNSPNPELAGESSMHSIEHQTQHQPLPDLESCVELLDMIGLGQGREAAQLPLPSQVVPLPSLALGKLAKPTPRRRLAGKLYAGGIPYMS